MSESVDLLLTGGTVVTMDPGGNVFAQGAVAIRAFNEHVRNDDRVVSVMLTIRDGVTLIRRA